MSFRGTTHDDGTHGTSSNDHKAVVAANYEACTRRREFHRDARNALAPPRIYANALITIAKLFRARS